MINMQQEIVTLKYSDSHSRLGFYWPYGFDICMVGSVHFNTNTKQHIFDNIVKPVLMSVQEAHDLFNELLGAGAY
jgi:hypothetical protein